jgi:hypothetical protein
MALPSKIRPWANSLRSGGRRGSKPAARRSPVDRTSVGWMNEDGDPWEKDQIERLSLLEGRMTGYNI